MRRRPFLSVLASAGLLSVLALGVAVAPAAAAANPAPDLSITAVGPNDPHVQRGSSFSVAFPVQGSAADASVTITTATEVTVRSATRGFDNQVATCTPTAGGTTCELGAITGYTPFTVVFDLAADAPIGSAPNVIGTVSSTAGVDSNPGDDAAMAGVIVAGHSVLTHAATPAALTFPAGGRGQVTFTVTNTGPDPATDVAMSFAIQTNDGPAPTFAGFSSAVQEPVAGNPQWRIGDLAVGASVEITATVAASGTVTDSELSYTTTFAGGEVCDNDACLDGVALRTVAAGSGPTTPPSPVAPGAPRPRAGRTPALAATGSDDVPLTVLGIGLVLVGAATTVGGRRRIR